MSETMKVDCKGKRVRQKEKWKGWGINIMLGRGSREKTCHGILVCHSDTIDITDNVADASRLRIVAIDAACCFCTKETWFFNKTEGCGTTP